LDKNSQNKDVVLGYDLGAEKVVAEWSSAGLNVQGLCPVTRDAQFSGETTFLGWGIFVKSFIFFFHRFLDVFIKDYIF
jgi:hypothetical protein